MPQTQPPTASTVPDRPPLIPPADTVRDRLLQVCREARLLRRQLKVSREAQEQTAPASAGKAVANG